MVLAARPAAEEKRAVRRGTGQRSLDVQRRLRLPAALATLPPRAGHDCGRRIRSAVIIVP